MLCAEKPHTSLPTGISHRWTSLTSDIPAFPALTPVLAGASWPHLVKASLLNPSTICTEKLQAAVLEGNQDFSHKVHEKTNNDGQME